MAYIRKTSTYYELLHDYGYGDGLEVLTAADTFLKIRAFKQDYITNENIYPKIVERREKISANSCERLSEKILEEYRETLKPEYLSRCDYWESAVRFEEMADINTLGLVFVHDRYPVNKILPCHIVYHFLESRLHKFLNAHISMIDTIDLLVNECLTV
jgi:hypothetical protein